MGLRNMPIMAKYIVALPTPISLCLSSLSRRVVSAKCFLSSGFHCPMDVTWRGLSIRNLMLLEQPIPRDVGLNGEDRKARQYDSSPPLPLPSLL